MLTAEVQNPLVPWIGNFLCLAQLAMLCVAIPMQQILPNICSLGVF